MIGIIILSLFPIASLGILLISLSNVRDDMERDEGFRNGIKSGDSVFLDRPSGMYQGKVMRVYPSKVCLNIRPQGIVWAQRREIFPDHTFESDKRAFNLNIFKFISDGRIIS